VVAGRSGALTGADAVALAAAGVTAPVAPVIVTAVAAASGDAPLELMVVLLANIVAGPVSLGVVSAALAVEPGYHVSSQQNVVGLVGPQRRNRACAFEAVECSPFSVLGGSHLEDTRTTDLSADRCYSQEFPVYT
jgi:hypothetical protein